MRISSVGRTATRQADSLILPDVIEITTDASGDLAQNLVPGPYRMEVYAQDGANSTPIKLTVPDATTAILAQIINLPLPPSLNAAEQAVLDAQAARDAANADAAATAADRVVTGQDATATAADRVQTGLDATATAADRVATGEDAAQTALDAQSTAADRTQTGQDSADATTQAGIATTKAGEANTSAQTATTQAGIATTKAGEASTSALQAETFAAGSELRGAVGNLSAVLGQVAGQIPALEGKVAGADGAAEPGLLALMWAGQISKQVNGGQAVLKGGTLADPALRIGSAGIYSSATDTLSVAIAGVEVVRFTASGLTIFGTITEA
ncbi:MAG: hypothetical protein LC676_04950 [Loktanella sp.]|nr:hypothetical protein [Loktanella sp.]